MFFKNVKVNWAIVQDSDENGNWRLDAFPNAEEIKELEGYGVPIKKDESSGAPFVNCKRKNKSNAGKIIMPPVVVDASNAPYEGLIGNGSICNVAVSIYDWEYMGKKGSACWLTAVQVVTLETYNASPFEAVGEPLVSPAMEKAEEVGDFLDRDFADQN